MRRLRIERAPRRATGVASVAVALLVTGPLLAPGFTLVYDMVFVPHPHWSRALLGIAPSFPRTVPTQLMVTAVSTVLPATLVQKAILLFIFGGSVAGAARLINRAPAAARVGAGMLYAWNPFVYERLLLGHWPILLGYAILPWAVAAARSFRRRTPGSGARLMLSLAALTVASPYLGIIGGATVVSIALWPPADRRPDTTVRRPNRWLGALVVAGGLCTSLPWLVPVAMEKAAPVQARLSVDLFAARADSPLGTAGSLISLGGSWRTDLAPPGRAGFAWLPAFALILGLALFGWRRMSSAWPPGARRGLLAAAAVGFVLAIAPRVPGARGAVIWAVHAMPGGGFLRDSEKFIIPLALAEAVAFGSGLAALLEKLAGTDRLLRRMASMLAVLPVALAPTLAWGASGRLHTASYPESWGRVQRVTAEDPHGGGILVLPWHAYLPFGWNHDQIVHQPAPLFLSRPVLSASRLEFGTATLAGEDPWSRRADQFLLRPGTLAPHLRELGVRYVVLFKEGDWKPLLGRVEGLEPVLDTPDLALYRSGAAATIPSFPLPPAGPVLLGDLIALGVILASAVAAVRAAAARRAGRPLAPRGSPG